MHKSRKKPSTIKYNDFALFLIFFFDLYFFIIGNYRRLYYLNFPYMNVLNSAPPPIKYEITLPKINFKKIKTSRAPSKDNLLQFSHQQCTEELAKLDEWTNALPTVRVKTYQPSESIMFLYKSNNKYYGHGNRPSQNRQALALTIGMYLAQLEAQLAKVKKINYDAIYQNVQYCAGVYEIAFNEILKKLQNMKKILKDNLKEKLKNIQQFREKKINQMRAKKQTPPVSVTDKRSEYEKSYFLRQNFKLRDSEQNDSQNHQQSPQNKLEQKYRQNNEKQKEHQVPKNGQKNKLLIDFKQAIEDKYQELEPIKILLKKLEKARMIVLYFSLELGFDVRQQGLTWILKQINKKPALDEQNKQNLRDSTQGLTPITLERQNRSRHRQIDLKSSRQKQEQKIIPKMSEFPNFLTEQQINFIISKFKNDFKLKIIETEKLSKEEQQKAILQNAFENVRRDRNRKLSMIKEKQLLEKLLNEKKCQVAVGHKYITCETVRLMQNSQKIKYTKNQLIYKQALRKLNRFCIKQINSKKQKAENSPLNNSKGSRRSSKKSISSLMGRRSTHENNEQIHKFMDEVKKMLTETNKLKDKEEKIKNQEEKQLADILMKLRNERYEGRVCSDRRNPISVIACLVGWKKAKKIMQNQMNISMFTSSQN